jgi:DNA-binding response OmpR family regulator
MEGKKGKILLVEDDQMIVEMYKLRLEADGFEVVVTDKGSRALELAQQERFNIILLDVILPETDGFSILQGLKSEEKTKNIPVLLLTNLGQESDKDKGIQLGAADYFVKSQHTPAEVLSKINELLLSQ